MITDSSGNVCYDADFLPFGAEIDATDTCAQNYKFEGKERDAETGNDDFGARYYSSNFGRWLSPDWSAIPAPIPYADITNPQSLNLYSMVQNDPETFADIGGHHISWHGGEDPGPIGTITYLDDISAKNIDDDYHQSNTDCTGHPCTMTASVTVSTKPPKRSFWGRVKSWFSVGTWSIGAIIRNAWGGERAGMPFKRAMRREIVQRNQEENNGENPCVYCGQQTVPPQQSQADVKPPQNEMQLDHGYPQSQGGDGTTANGNVACRGCNNAKSDSLPEEPGVQQPGIEDPDVIPVDIELIP